MSPTNRLEMRGRLVGRATSLLTVMTALWLVALPCHGFTVSSVEARLESPKRLSVGVQSAIELSADVIQALESSIPITIETTIKIYRVRAKLWDKLVYEAIVRDEISYRSLYRTYQLRTADPNIRDEFQSLDRLLSAIGQQRVHQVDLEVGSFDPQESYVGKIKVALDRSKLPSVMRIPVTFKKSWRLKSDWVEFKVE